MKSNKDILAGGDDTEGQVSSSLPDPVLPSASSITPVGEKIREMIEAGKRRMERLEEEHRELSGRDDDQEEFRRLMRRAGRS